MSETRTHQRGFASIVMLKTFPKHSSEGPGVSHTHHELLVSSEVSISVGIPVDHEAASRDSGWVANDEWEAAASTFPSARATF